MVMSIKQENIKSLRDVIYWRSERDTASFNLEKSEKELAEALKRNKLNGVSEHIIHLLLEDNTGSGVREILERKGIEIEPEDIESTAYKGQEINLNTWLRPNYETRSNPQGDIFDYMVKRLYKDEYGKTFLELLPVRPSSNIPYKGLSKEGVKMQQFTCSMTFLSKNNLEVVTHK